MASLLNLSGGSLLNKGLPYDAEIEYLESTGTQWIDTGVIPNDSTLMQIKFINTKATGTVIIGYVYGRNNSFRFFNYNQQIYLDLFGEGNRAYGSVCKTNTLYEFEIGNRYVKNISTDNVIFSFPPIHNQGEVSYTITLNGSRDFSKNKWYYVKIYKNGVLLRDFIPVRKGNVGYMYDKVSGQLFGNAGTGAFILGPDKTN